MKTSKMHVYRDVDHRWRWRLRAANGRIIADSGQGYASKSAALDAAARLMTAAVEARHSDVMIDSPDPNLP